MNQERPQSHLDAPEPPMRLSPIIERRPGPVEMKEEDLVEIDAGGEEIIPTLPADEEEDMKKAA